MKENITNWKALMLNVFESSLAKISISLIDCIAKLSLKTSIFLSQN